MWAFGGSVLGVVSLVLERPSSDMAGVTRQLRPGSSYCHHPSQRCAQEGPSFPGRSLGTPPVKGKGRVEQARSPPLHWYPSPQPKQAMSRGLNSNGARMEFKSASASRVPAECRQSAGRVPLRSYSCQGVSEPAFAGFIDAARAWIG